MKDRPPLRHPTDLQLSQTGPDLAHARDAFAAADQTGDTAAALSAARKLDEVAAGAVEVMRRAAGEIDRLYRDWNREMETSIEARQALDDMTRRQAARGDDR